LMAGVQKDSGYQAFWEDVGTGFPSLKGAASTRYYFECERILCEQFLPSMKDLLVLKTDLWDEAKNSEILLWMAEKGARPAGIDLSFEVVRQAERVLSAFRPVLAVADVRSLPFPANSFDLIYSMGTIEHFEDSAAAVREFFRVLRPSGIAIVGVPNKLDPFMRPMLVSLWNAFGAYPYGMEKSFTSRGLRRLLESAGFRSIGQSGILFMPGWLRVMDLWCHVHTPQLARLTGWLVSPFAWAYRSIPSLRRHGYLIAWAVSKPAGPAGIGALQDSQAGNAPGPP
jgi:SAM-dependent methyltransferase